MEKSRLEQIEKYIINFLRERGHTRILARELFESTAISLTPQGVAHLGLEEVEVEDELPALPHPPKSATKMV